MLKIAGIVMPLLVGGMAHAATLVPDTVALIKETTFEVVVPKPDEAGITYDQPVNFDLLPFSYRNDKYVPIGTAFAIPGGVIATAAHVLGLHQRQLHGIPLLRDADGKIHEIDKVVKYAYRQDFVLFTLKDYHPAKFLPLNESPRINTAVFAVGNALGEGIVIRDGNYTSNTPESQDGEWSWMRFSAAASPGNSGGPLLDDEGKVLGIVVAKSENENLNYALPISELAHIPDDMAVFNSRVTYLLPNMDYRYSDTCKIEVKLPLPAEKLRAKLEPALDKFDDQMLSALQEKYKDEIFPQGAGSQKLLYATLNDKDLTTVIKSTNGDWVQWKPNQQQIDLGDNGFLTVAPLNNLYYLMRVRKPDGLDIKTLLEDEQKLMDMVLKVYPLERNTGFEKRRVTSLGLPQGSNIVQDRYGRIWKQHSWNIPYMDRTALLYTAPTPEGAVMLFSLPTVQGLNDFKRDSRVVLDFVHFLYRGTLVEWHSFLSKADIIPEPLKGMQVKYEDEKFAAVETAVFKMRCTEDCMSISEKSELDIGFVFDGNGADLKLRIASAEIRDSMASDRIIKLAEIKRPPESLGERVGQQWRDASRELSPFDGEPLYKQGFTMVAKSILRGDKEDQKQLDADSRYVLVYWQKGEQDKIEFKKSFDALSRGAASFP